MYYNANFASPPAWALSPAATLLMLPRNVVHFCTSPALLWNRCPRRALYMHSSDQRAASLPNLVLRAVVFHIVAMKFVPSPAAWALLAAETLLMVPRYVVHFCTSPALFWYDICAVPTICTPFDQRAAVLRTLVLRASVLQSVVHDTGEDQPLHILAP